MKSHRVYFPDICTQVRSNQGYKSYIQENPFFQFTCKFYQKRIVQYILLANQPNLEWHWTKSTSDDHTNKRESNEDKYLIMKI